MRPVIEAFLRLLLWRSHRAFFIPLLEGALLSNGALLRFGSGSTDPATIEHFAKASCDPRVTVLPGESMARGFDVAPIYLDRYRRVPDVLQKRWQTESFQDPMHHPALDRQRETYRITF